MAGQVTGDDGPLAIAVKNISNYSADKWINSRKCLLHFMGSVAIGTLAALIGVLSGAKLTAVLKLGKLDERLLLVEDVIPELITRAEVQDAFQQVAQAEAQRMQQQQQQAAVQARQQAAFSERASDTAL